MTRKSFLLSALTIIVVASTVAWLFFLGRVAYLSLDRRLTIEVNGTPVQGSVLRNRITAIVTRRDADNKHSYELFFEGDTDFTGVMGSVVDCHEWVAPDAPLLLETRSYPPCWRMPEDETVLRRWPLIRRGNSMQFITKDHATISVAMPH
jgi:hypothetical protein